jgi:hypothetical protein
MSMDDSRHMESVEQQPWDQCPPGDTGRLAVATQLSQAPCRPLSPWLDCDHTVLPGSHVKLITWWSYYYSFCRWESSGGGSSSTLLRIAKLSNGGARIRTLTV